MDTEINGDQATDVLTDVDPTPAKKPKPKKDGKKGAKAAPAKSAVVKSNGTVSPKSTPARKAVAPKEEPAEVNLSKPGLKGRIDEAATLIKSAADPTRLGVLLFLAEGEQFVGAICDHLGMTQPAVSHHLAMLRYSGLVAPRRQGKQNFYALAEKGRRLVDLVGVVLSQS